jgi:hypothetical protein
MSPDGRRGVVVVEAKEEVWMENGRMQVNTTST